MPNKQKIYAFSDATGELVHQLIKDVIQQFPDIDFDITRIPKLDSKEKIEKCLAQASKEKAVVLFTLVSIELREFLAVEAERLGLLAIDVLGPTLDQFASLLEKSPAATPGIQYKMTQSYFKRTEAVEYSVKHDDGLGLDTLELTDILILGISRTSKTPLSIYLAYHGYRAANIPLVKGIPVPKVVEDIPNNKIVGLTIDPRKLSTIRTARLKKLGRPETESYASIAHIQEEVRYALNLFKQMKVPVIDVTGRAIEETASEIIYLLNLG